jgi:uncharacterized damage-inducible protein DinB
MQSLDYFRTLSRYNRWMNEKMYAVCSTIPDETRRADRGAFFKSVHGTLNHILLADRLWLGRFLQQPFAVESLAQELYHDWDELCRERQQTDDSIERWVNALTQEQIAVPISYTSIVNPETRTYPLWITMTHFFNHQTHHRGQLTTLMEQMGYDSGITDLIWMVATKIEK